VESEIDRLRKKVENFPSASLYNRLAELTRQSGAVEESEDICRRCIKEFPRNSQAYIILAEIESARGAHAVAMSLLTTAIDRDPRSVNGHRLMADLLVEDNEITQALTHYNTALALKPNDAVIGAKIVELEKKHGVTSQAVTLPPQQQMTLKTLRTNAAENKLATASTIMPSPFAETPAAAAAAPAAKGTSRIARAPEVAAPAVAAGPSPSVVLDGLCAENGVRGALIADASGRVVVAKNITGGQEDILAALALDVGKAGTQALGTLGIDRLTTWALSAADGQVLVFQRDANLATVVLADPGVRPAMLELRARQALIDLGAGA
jgi:predicted regulator of Ras-like GTPase activity (Roadblock/LC7/MglB family)/lipopolysaccharide biosynthesis regulator YciM